jgi:alpha/beta superfamily hydrolase
MLQLNQPGEHPFFFQGVVGALEAILTVPPTVDNRYIALLGHPHSLQGGTMQNKVVTTLARVFKELGIASIRFNFRGVGQSQGEYDAGVGEGQDLLRLLDLCQQEMPGVQYVFAGFSFGSYVTYRAAAQSPHALLISVAPSVHHYNYAEFPNTPRPWIIVQGDIDEVVPVEKVRAFVSQSPSPIVYLECKATSHFFHGKLVELKSVLLETISAQGYLCR